MNKTMVTPEAISLFLTKVGYEAEALCGANPFTFEGNTIHLKSKPDKMIDVIFHTVEIPERNLERAELFIKLDTVNKLPDPIVLAYYLIGLFNTPVSVGTPDIAIFGDLSMDKEVIQDIVKRAVRK